MSKNNRGRAFIVMPFRKKTALDGSEIDFDLVYEKLIKPAVEAAGLEPFRADEEFRAGSIHADMFQELLLAELVLADLTIDNANVFYEIGVRHALRARGSVMLYSGRDRLPFDIAGERMLKYQPIRDPVDAEAVAADCAKLTKMVEETLSAWRGRKTSPVFALLPNLEEPSWKNLRVGAINEYWEALETWRERVDTARKNLRPGDILALAEETPTRIFELEALRIAGRALLTLNRPIFARRILERAARLDPDDLLVQQQLGLALGRAGEWAKANTLFERLVRTARDGETGGLYGRTLKDHWTSLWRIDGLSPAERIARAKESARSLADAAVTYAQAFQADPKDYFPGINALTLGHLWTHLSGRRPKIDLDLIAQGVRWTVEAALARKSDYWALATKAELRLVAYGDSDCLDHFEEAAAVAVRERDRFALDSTSQQLDMLKELEFRTELVAQAAAVIDRAESQLDPHEPEPAKVVLFSGHMIDKPDREKARFPATKVSAARARIRAELDKIGAGAGDLGTCGGACGGDLLFAEACLERGMRIELRIAQEEGAFLNASVRFAGAEWVDLYGEVKRRGKLLVAPDELGPPPKWVNIYERNNLWLLYSALAHGLGKVFFVALWDGKGGDGPGGTQHMVEIFNDYTDKRAQLIDPAELPATGT
jgi:tetratricopeptide (TPR) repeat protein